MKKQRDPRSHFLEDLLPKAAGASLVDRMKAKKKRPAEESPAEEAMESPAEESAEDAKKKRRF